MSYNLKHVCSEKAILLFKRPAISIIAMKLDIVLSQIPTTIFVLNVTDNWLTISESCFCSVNTNQGIFHQEQQKPFAPKLLLLILMIFLSVG